LEESVHGKRKPARPADADAAQGKTAGAAQNQAHRPHQRQGAVRRGGHQPFNLLPALSRRIRASGGSRVRHHPADRRIHHGDQP